MKRFVWIMMLALVLTLSACGNSEGSSADTLSRVTSETVEEGSSEESGAIPSESLNFSSSGVSVESGSSKPVSSETSVSADSKPISPVKYTDGNIYVLTDDLHFIIKIDPKFSGYEILYEGKLNETIYPPVYRNGALFFMGETFEEPEKIYRLDISTKKVTAIFSADKVPDFSDWTILGDQIFIRSIKSGDIVTIWACNLDGSNLRKTAAADMPALSLPAEYNGKVYMVRYFSTDSTAVFYEMNLNGTGFQKAFAQTHPLCKGFEILGIQEGHIYYSAQAVLNQATGVGIYKVKTDGSGSKKLLNNQWSHAATDGKNLYIPSDDTTEGITRIDQSDGVSHNIALKGAAPYSLTNLYNGYLYADCDPKNYLLSLSDNKAYAIEDFSPPSPFAKYKHGLNILSMPAKTTYKVGEGFDSTGFDSVYYISGRGMLKSGNDSITYTTSDGVKLTQGRPFQSPGTKTIEIRYNGSKVATYTVTVTADTGNVSAGLKILAYPAKTEYKVGEGFDAAGLNAVYYAEDGTAVNVNDKITFYTSQTVELTQGRPFQTAGTKVVELRYNGEKISTYTIIVKE